MEILDHFKEHWKSCVGGVLLFYAVNTASYSLVMDRHLRDVGEEISSGRIAAACDYSPDVNKGVSRDSLVETVRETLRRSKKATHEIFSEDSGNDWQDIFDIDWSSTMISDIEAREGACTEYAAANYAIFLEMAEQNNPKMIPLVRYVTGSHYNSSQGLWIEHAWLEYREGNEWRTFESTMAADDDENYRRKTSMQIGADGEVSVDHDFYEELTDFGGNVRALVNRTISMILDQ